MSTTDYLSVPFDGTESSSNAPCNNATSVPAPGTPGFDAYVRADEEARAKYGSGINTDRLRTLAADAEAAKKTRAGA